MKKILTLVCGIALMAGCTDMNKEKVKANAVATFKQSGFEVVGYEGWERGLTSPFGNGGALVWYTLKRIPDNGIIYHAAIKEWDGEYHIYNLSAVDAIKP